MCISLHRLTHTDAQFLFLFLFANKTEISTNMYIQYLSILKAVAAASDPKDANKGWLSSSCFCYSIVQALLAHINLHRTVFFYSFILLVVFVWRRVPLNRWRILRNNSRLSKHKGLQSETGPATKNQKQNWNVKDVSFACNTRIFRAFCLFHICRAHFARKLCFYAVAGGSRYLRSRILHIELITNWFETATLFSFVLGIYEQKYNKFIGLQCGS